MSKKAAAQRRAKERRKRAQLAAEQERLVQRKPRLDRLADWLAARPRFLRIGVAALIAIIVTAAAGIFLFSYLFTLDPSRLPPNILTLSLVGLTVTGPALYWIGWRVMVGFDFADEPMRPGRPAALWLLFGIGVTFTIVALSVFSVIQALMP